MRSVFHQLPLVEYGNFVAETAGSQAVRDKNRDMLAGNIFRTGIDFVLPNGIQRGGRFIQHEKRRILIQCAGQRDELGFAAGEPMPCES